MEVRKMEDGDFSAVCAQITKTLLDSVEASYQLDGISDKESLTNAFTQSRIKYWLKIGEVWIAGENQGMLAGHYRKNENSLASIRPAFALIKNVRRALSKEDRVRLMSNVKKSNGAENITWRKRTCKKQNYFYIDMIAIDRTLKGSGAFRRLIDPVIARCQHENIPLLLDTHDKDNVAIYSHFGFELVGEYRSKSNPCMVQYSMIKSPCGH